MVTSYIAEGKIHYEMIRNTHSYHEINEDQPNEKSNGYLIEASYTTRELAMVTCVRQRLNHRQRSGECIIMKREAAGTPSLKAVGIRMLYDGLTRSGASYVWGVYLTFLDWYYVRSGESLGEL